MSTFTITAITSVSVYLLVALPMTLWVNTAIKDSPLDGYGRESKLSRATGAIVIGFGWPLWLVIAAALFIVGTSFDVYDRWRK